MYNYKCKDKSIHKISTKDGEILSITNPYWYVSAMLVVSDDRIIITVEKNDEVLRSDSTHTARGRKRKGKDRGPRPRKGDWPQKTDKRKRKAKTNKKEVY